jgi:transposase
VGESGKRIKKVTGLLSYFFCMTVVKRILCAMLLAFEVDVEKIHGELGISYKSIKKYEAILDSEEYDRLLRIGEHKRASELDDYQEVIFKELDSGAYHTLREIAVMIEKKTGLKRSRNRIHIFLKKNGYKPLKVGFIPAKADGGKQREFYQNILEPLMSQAKAGIVKLFFVDASHFVMGGFSGAIWTTVRRYVQTACGRQRYNVLGALDYATKKVETITNSSYITAIEVMTLIDKLAAAYAGPLIKLVLDNTRYQHCKAVFEHAAKVGVELIFLPTYSPNLNLIERLWKFVKTEVLNAAYHSSFDGFMEIIDVCIQSTHTIHKKRLESLISGKVQFFDNMAGQNAIVGQTLVAA